MFHLCSTFKRHDRRDDANLVFERRGPAALAALGLVVAAAVLGQALAGDDPFDALEGYDQPWFGLSSTGWLVVGILYYSALVVVLFRLVRGLPVSRASLALVLVVIVANEMWNVFIFGLRAPVAAFVGIVLFAVLVLLAVRSARRHDKIASWGLGAYALWVIVYDIPWTLALVLLN